MFSELCLHSLIADNLDFRWVRFLWMAWLPIEIYHFRVFFFKEENLLSQILQVCLSKTFLPSQILKAESSNDLGRVGNTFQLSTSLE